MSIDEPPVELRPQERPELDSVEAALGVTSDRWSFLLLREAFYGVRRFSDFQRNLGIARKVLSARLALLVENGLLERRRYQDRPTRHEYRLAPKGLDLYPVIVALMQWGDRWLMDEPPLLLSHAADDGEVRLEMRCQSCGKELRAPDITPKPNTARTGG